MGMVLESVRALIRTTPERWLGLAQTMPVELNKTPTGPGGPPSPLGVGKNAPVGHKRRVRGGGPGKGPELAHGGERL
jgi:hypothetical protein